MHIQPYQNKYQLEHSLRNNQTKHFHFKIYPNSKSKKENSRKNSRYFLIRNDKIIYICRNCFKVVFGIENYRLDNILKKLKSSNFNFRKKSGGDRISKSNEIAISSIESFLEYLPFEYSHYRREEEKISYKYLRCSENITSLYLQFSSLNPSISVSYQFFRRRFHK